MNKYYLNYVVYLCVKLSYIFFLNKGGGVIKWKLELYFEYFGYEVIGVEIYFVFDIFF